MDDLARAGALGDLPLGGEGPHRWVVAAGGAYLDGLLHDAPRWFTLSGRRSLKSVAGLLPDQLEVRVVGVVLAPLFDIAYPFVEMSEPAEPQIDLLRIPGAEQHDVGWLVLERAWLLLRKARQARPNVFTDLSLAVIKLIGRGEYHVLPGGRVPEGHFGLALNHYAHSTAPNRRYPDLVTQRLLKAALGGTKTSVYSLANLQSLALHCTQQEDAANKVERQVKKCAAAELLEDRRGSLFLALVTGSSDKGTWVRIKNPPVEGKLLRGGPQLKVGDRLRVRLVATNVEKGFIDFAKA